ncbi:MAG: hypothetical protein AB7I50_21125 [Vicinamibacterales bacterium]
MTNRLAGFTLAAALMAGATLPLIASTPTFWEVSSLSEFLRGDLNGLTIDADGRLALGPELRQVADTTAPMIWRLLDADNGSVLAGTGNDGKVFRIAANGTMTTAFDSSELQVHALALARDGGFYAGTSPDGKVYRVARDGTSTEVFDPDDTYIWAMVTASDGTLYVATGEKGTIYKVSPDGKAAPFYKTRATNVTSLALDPAGNLIAGTSSPGQVLRIDAQGRAFMLLESTFPEIRALRFDARGNLFVVAVSAPPQPTRPPAAPAVPDSTAAPIASVSTEITITAIGDVPTTPTTTATPATRTDARRDTTRGAIYRVLPDGLWEPFWESTEDVPYDISVEADGSLVVATGPKGRVLKLAGDPVRVTVLARADAQQVTSLARNRQGALHLATANPGKLFELSKSLVSEGTYESDVRDATNVASWGFIRWQATSPAGSSVQLLTRSGNTKTPDDTWSPWSAAYTTSDGQSITSPKARYLQWKAVLSGKNVAPELSAVTVAYLPHNTRPSIDSITVHPPGVAFARPFPTGDPEVAGFNSGTAENRPVQPATSATGAAQNTALGRRLYHKGLQTFVWKGDDEPGDKLQYDVYYRRQGESEWTPLRRELWDSIVTWDTTSVPDGTYTVKVVATDQATNAPGAALTGERESASFDVDNTAPAVSITGVQTTNGRRVLSFTVRDASSQLDRVEYSIDATQWQVVYPVDGIADSKEERYEAVLENDVEFPVTVRAVDALNNTGSATAMAP